MKKRLLKGLVLIMCVGLLAGCGKNYQAEKSTVFVLKDGKVVSTDVEDFDTGLYSEDALKTFVDDAVADYTAEHGKNVVEVDKVKVKDNVATLTLKYASAEDYQNFTGVEMFCGTVAEALAKGYSFDGEFAKVSNGVASVCENTNFLKEEGLKVVAIKANTIVEVPGEILYVSAKNTTFVDEKTIAIQIGDDMFLQEEETETSGTEVVGTETVGEEVILEDEFFNDTEQAMEFEFPEEVETSEKSDVCTYIFYK